MNANVPDNLRPYVERVTFSEGSAAHDGVELLLTAAGVKFAREGANLGSMDLALWLKVQPKWQGNRSAKNVANEISTHALYANWPVLGNRANPVNIEYFQTWPVSLFLKVRDALGSRLRLP